MFKNKIISRSALLHLLTIFFTLYFSSCEFLPGTRGPTKAPDGTCNCEVATYDFCVRVTKVTDGDSFRGINEDNEELLFRIHGIDAPENKQAFGRRSKDYLSSIVYGRKVGLNINTKDRWGRYVVSVYTADCLDVAAEMLRAGMAWHFRRYDITKYYSNLEKEAREFRVGLWKDPAPVPPWEYRRRKE